MNRLLKQQRESMSERALFKPVRATLNLSGITAMNTAMTNVLLAKMVFTKNPSSPTDIFKEVSDRILTIVLERAESGGLTKGELRELSDIARAYRTILERIE